MDSMIATGFVILSGASGMLGSAIREALQALRVRSLQLLRRVPEAEGQLRWNPSAQQPVENPSALEGAGAAIHLSGANVAAHRWTPSYRRQMESSRIDSTRRLSELLASLKQPPRTLLVASAIGIYGDRGDEPLDESTAPGHGFLADLCRNWEAAAKPALDAGIRVVHLRFGVVLGPGQGALAEMLPPFRLGIGAKLGNGRQWMSWVALEDAVAATLFAMERTVLSGPVNVTAPAPVTNAEFTRVLGRVLKRPALLTVPAFAMRLIFGQMADEALLASARAVPAKLLQAGFSFSFPTLGEALEKELP